MNKSWCYKMPVLLCVVEDMAGVTRAGMSRRGYKHFRRANVD